jgi:hypothetical protein
VLVPTELRIGQVGVGPVDGIDASAARMRLHRLCDLALCGFDASAMPSVFAFVGRDLAFLKK